jgi:hypothetical protein
LAEERNPKNVKNVKNLKNVKNPIGGKAYVIRTEEVEIKPVAPKKFNMYGDY